MLSAQNLLPRLPVPKLADSLSRFLRAVRPLLDDTEYAKTQSLVDEFVSSGVGPKLQTHLEKRAANTTLHDNWLSEWWLNNAYLEFRYPCMLFSNPSYFLPTLNFSSPDDQFRLASGVISAALDYRTRVVKGELAPEVVGKDRRLCMSQFTKLFDACRVPAPDRDYFVVPPSGPSASSDSKSVDVVLLYKNKFFNLEVDSSSTDPQSIYDSIIGLKQHNNSVATPPIGILTSWNRDKWAVAHQRLESAHKLNAISLEAIRRCAFVVCLDTQPMKPESGSYNRMTRSFDLVLHGGGSSVNTGNRWFDKTVQFIISNDGIWGACLEHGPCEAFPLVALTDHVATTLVKKPSLWRNLSSGRGSQQNLKPLEFKLTPDLEDSISSACRDADTLVSDLDTNVHVFTGWGRDAAKTINASADGLVQLAMQVAYYRVHGTPASAYETGSTRRFLLGRTDTIRPCSVESLALCKELSSRHNVKMDTAKVLLTNALKAHGEYMSAALSGRAFDRHFMGLKMAAKELGVSQPAIFSDKGYQKAVHYVLSTSQVSSKFDEAAMGYAPLVPDGYGCCYSIRPGRVVFSVSSWRSCSTTDSRRFGVALSDAMDQLFRIASSGDSSKAKTAAASL